MNTNKDVSIPDSELYPEWGNCTGYMHPDFRGKELHHLDGYLIDRDPGIRIYNWDCRSSLRNFDIEFADALAEEAEANVNSARYFEIVIAWYEKIDKIEVIQVLGLKDRQTGHRRFFVLYRIISQ